MLMAVEAGDRDPQCQGGSYTARRPGTRAAAPSLRPKCARVRSLIKKVSLTEMTISMVNTWRQKQCVPAAQRTVPSPEESRPGRSMAASWSGTGIIGWLQASEHRVREAARPALPRVGSSDS